MKRTMLVIALVIVAITVVWVYPATTFTIDDTWWIVTEEKESYDEDVKSAELIADAYGATVLEITGDYEFNAFGQSFIFIGGSGGLAAEAPWTGLDPSWYGIIKPDTYPDVRWTGEKGGPFGIITPKGTFWAGPEHNYGLIAKGYDYKLRRWVVICIGYSTYATAAGARILVTRPTLVAENNWIVYEYNGGPVPLDSWSLQAFSNYEITETG